MPSLTIANESSIGYASWNGATEVAIYELLGSNDASAVVSLSNTSAVGRFETNFTVPTATRYSYYQVRALDAAFEPLGYSEFVSSANGTSVQPAATQTPAVGAANATTASSTMGSAAATGAASTSRPASGATREAGPVGAIAALIAIASLQLV